MINTFPIVLSPYDLDARGLATDVALILGNPAVTLLPAPLEGLDAASVRAAAATAPEFQNFIARWSWMQDLWRHGVIRPDFAGLSPVDFVQETAREIAEAAAPGQLSALVASGIFDSTNTYLRSICRDLSRGGGQPSVSVPVSIGMSRYAHAIDAPLLQQHNRQSGSVVQRLETRATRIAAGLTLLIPRDIEPETLLSLRDTLPLNELHEALRSQPAHTEAIESQWNRHITEAAAPLRIATHARRGRRLATIRISVAAMPLGATLAAATHAAALASPRRASRATTQHAPSPTSLAQRPLRILSVRELPWTHSEP